MNSNCKAVTVFGCIRHHGPVCLLLCMTTSKTYLGDFRKQRAELKPTYTFKDMFFLYFSKIVCQNQILNKTSPICSFTEENTYLHQFLRLKLNFWLEQRKRNQFPRICRELSENLYHVYTAMTRDFTKDFQQVFLDDYLAILLSLFYT